MNNVKEFLKEYNELVKKYGLEINRSCSYDECNSELEIATSAESKSVCKLHWDSGEWREIL